MRSGCFLGLALLTAVSAASAVRAEDAPAGCVVPASLLESESSLPKVEAAVKAGQPLSAPEISALLERRQLVADSHHCPHGRPTALVFTRADLEKQFGRV